MSKASKKPSLGIDPDQEEAIGGWSKKGKKATRVENKGDNKKKERSQSKKATRVENKGDNKKKERSQSKKATPVENKGNNKKWGCRICSSTRHPTYNCSWIQRIPGDVVSIPELGPNWVITCLNCGNHKNYPENSKKCPKCGECARYVAPKKCVHCHRRGHFDKYDEDCMYFGMTGENDPIRVMLMESLKKHGLDPKKYLTSPYL